MIKFKTSWDDGSYEDLKLSELLNKYNLEATFYIPAKNKEREVIKQNEILELAQFHNLGSHTYNHVYLTKIPLDNVYSEVYNGRIYLEDIVGKEIGSFCYPGGFYNKKIENIIKPIVDEARTTRIFSLKKDEKFSYHTSIHLAERGIRSHFINAIVNSPLIFKYGLIDKILTKNDIFSICKYLILECLKNQNEDYTFHIWGHSWEIEENNNWKEVEQIFKLISDINEK